MTVDTFSEYLDSLYSQWRMNSFYKDYSRFLKCFDLKSNGHRDSGNSNVYYHDNFEYTYEVDPEGDFIKFIKDTVESFAIKNVQFAKAWWVDYPQHSYAGMHCHQPGKQFTAVLFLSTFEIDKHNPHAGFLYTISSKNDNMEYEEYPVIAGNLHIFDGKIWHGTYPTLQDRKVFVCDFTYELDGE